MLVLKILQSKSMSPRYSNIRKITYLVLGIFWRHLTVPQFPYDKSTTHCSRSRWNLVCRQCWRHKETVGVSFIAQFVTHQNTWPQNDSLTYLKQVVRRANAITAMLRSTLQISTWIFIPIFCEAREKWFSVGLFVVVFLSGQLCSLFSIFRSLHR